MFRLKLFIVFIFFWFIVSCHHGQQESMEGFFEKGKNSGDTSTMRFHFRSDTIYYWDVNLLATAIANGNRYEGKYIGFGGRISEQYKLFEKLESTATDSMLIRLTDHGNPVVRAYAYSALAGRNSPALIPIFKKHLNDSEELETFGGCTRSSSGVNKFMLKILWPSEWKDPKYVVLPKEEARKYLKLITGSDNEILLYF